MDSYSVVSCTSEAGVTSHHTKIERNNLQPHWNERCTFEDVALSNNLTVAIFDHKKLSSDIFLGQVAPLHADELHVLAKSGANLPDMPSCIDMHLQVIPSDCTFQLVQ